MTYDIQKLLRFRNLMVLGSVLLIIVSISGNTSSTHSAPQFQPSPSPMATPPGQTNERPHPVRRFFSWVAEAVSRPFRQRVPRISDPPMVSVTSSTSMVNFCPPGTHSMDSCSASREVELSASPGGPDLDTRLLYVWAVTAGRIRGEGHKVVWDLSAVADGAYTATVEVNDGSGLTASASTTVMIALCQSCITVESPCPTVAVSCPEKAESNQSMTFQAHVYGGDPTVKATYTWSVSAGRISGGQGTATITVDASDITGRSITATVAISGHDPACVNTAGCTTQTAAGH